MADIIEFKRPEPEEPHAVGEAHCVACQHKWQAVVPTGTWQLECPECKSMKGMFTHPFGPKDGGMVYSCHCGCPALTALKEHGKFWLRCMHCGCDHTEAVFG